MSSIGNKLHTRLLGTTVLTALLLTATFSLVPALAQLNPGQVADPSTYQGSMELQRQQAESDAQMRAQNDAMQRRLDEQYATSSAGSSSGGGGGGRAAPPLKSHPLLPPARNPLLGRWQQTAAKPLNLGLLGQLPGVSEGVGGALAGGCKSVFGEAGIVFTPNSLNWLAEDGHEELLNRVEYRSDGANIIVIPTDSDLALILGLTDRDHAVVAIFGCQMRRLVAGQKPVPMASLTRGPVGAEPGREQTAGVGAGASISLKVGATVSGTFVPIGDAVFYIVSQDPEASLVKAGFTGPSAKESWLAVCRTNQERCNVGGRAMAANAVGSMRTDVAGNAEVPQLPAGRYFIFGHVAYQGKELVWLRPLVVQPGVNRVALEPSQGSTG